MSKSTLITFKVDPALSEVLQGVPNRSEFIRMAILNALENTCPVCRGSGILTVDERRHWDAFVLRHPLQECGNCHTMHPVCQSSPEAALPCG